jgi:hypothetical protein
MPQLVGNRVLGYLQQQKSNQKAVELGVAFAVIVGSFYFFTLYKMAQQRSDRWSRPGGSDGKCSVVQLLEMSLTYRLCRSRHYRPAPVVQALRDQNHQD